MNLLTPTKSNGIERFSENAKAVTRRPTSILARWLPCVAVSMTLFFVTDNALAYSVLHTNDAGRKTPWGNCTDCHGADLQGDSAPSCFTCHGQLWDDPVGTGGGGGGTGDNSPPNVDTGGPYTGSPGVPVEFDASGTTDPDGDAMTYLWLFGDGSRPSLPSQSPTTTHTFEEAGTYNAILSVTDGKNTPLIVDVIVTIGDGVTNLPPVADAGGPYNGIAQQAVLFDAGDSTDPEDDTLEYTWDFGDGSATETTQLPANVHVYQDAGIFTLTVSVTDGVNAPASDTASVTVAEPNLPPTANVGGPYSGGAGTAVQLSAAGSSDADDDPLTYEWDFGDGSPLDMSVSATIAHTYAAAGNYTVVVTVSDGVNEAVSDSASVQITAPTPTPSPTPTPTPTPSPMTGDVWDVRLPFVGSGGAVDIDQFAGFLFVKETFDQSATVYGIGIRFGGLIFWMDAKGALFMGTQTGSNAMAGLVFGFMGSGDTVWFAQAQATDAASGIGGTTGLLGGLLGGGGGSGLFGGMFTLF